MLFFLAFRDIYNYEKGEKMGKLENSANTAVYINAYLCQARDALVVGRNFTVTSKEHFIGKACTWIGVLGTEMIQMMMIQVMMMT